MSYSTKRFLVRALLAVLAVGIGTALPAFAGTVATVPLTAPGDSLSVKFDFVGRFPYQPEQNDTQTVRFTATSPGRASVWHSINYGDAQTEALIVHPDGTLGSPSATIRNDWAQDYNTIPLTLAGLKSKVIGATTWSTRIPVRITDTEWRDISSTGTARSAPGDRLIIDVTGKHSYPVYGNGFTSAADVAITYHAEFVRGKFKLAHFEMHEIVHAQIDLAVSYTWTMANKV